MQYTFLSNITRRLLEYSIDILYIYYTNMYIYMKYYITRRVPTRIIMITRLQQWYIYKFYFTRYVCLCVCARVFDVQPATLHIIIIIIIIAYTRIPICYV